MICPHCGKDSNVQPPTVKAGDKVRHKKRTDYGIGNVREISKSGKRAYVHWDKPDVLFSFSAYYDLGSLKTAE